MKPINILGKKISIKIEENKEEVKKCNYTSQDRAVNIRLIFLLIFIGLSVISSKLAYVEDIYKVGTVLRKDIIAPTSISYIDNSKKRELIDKLISEVDVVYIRDENIEKEVYDKINLFFKDLKIARENTNYEEYLQRLELKLNQEDVKRILDNKSIDKVRKEVIKTVEEIYDLGLRDNTEDMNSSLNELKLTGDNLVY